MSNLTRLELRFGAGFDCLYTGHFTVDLNKYSSRINGVQIKGHSERFEKDDHFTHNIEVASIDSHYKITDQARNSKVMVGITIPHLTAGITRKMEINTDYCFEIVYLCWDFQILIFSNCYTDLRRSTSHFLSHQVPRESHLGWSFPWDA